MHAIYHITILRATTLLSTLLLPLITTHSFIFSSDQMISAVFTLISPFPPTLGLTFAIQYNCNYSNAFALAFCSTPTSSLNIIFRHLLCFALPRALTSAHTLSLNLALPSPFNLTLLFIRSPALCFHP